MDEQEWHRLNNAWIRRAICEALDECVAKLVELQELVGQLPDDPQPESCSPPKPDP